MGETLGGILAGFDQQVLRQQPPAQELVLKGSPVRGLSGDDPGDLEIFLPGPPVRSETDPGAAAPDAGAEGEAPREEGSSDLEGDGEGADDTGDRPA